MQIQVLGDKLATISTAGTAALYRRKKLIGRCIDTPNAIACAMYHTGATRAVDTFGEVVKISKIRISQNANKPLDFSGFAGV